MELNNLITIIVIYAPGLSNERRALWQKVVEANIPRSSFVLAGDFTFVETEADWNGSNRYFTKPNHREQVA